MEICDILVDMRKRSGRTQQQMANHIGVDIRTYQNYEYGNYEISAKDFLRLTQYCRYYEILGTIEDFIKNFIGRDYFNRGTQWQAQVVLNT